MAPIKLFASLLLLLATSNIILVRGCSCPPGVWEANTPEEKAAYIRDKSGENLYVIATFINETSYEKIDDYDYGHDDDTLEPMVFTYQNTTWLVKEVVYNSDRRPYWPRGTTIQNRDKLYMKHLLIQHAVCAADHSHRMILERICLSWRLV